MGGEFKFHHTQAMQTIGTKLIPFFFLLSLSIRARLHPTLRPRVNHLSKHGSIPLAYSGRLIKLPFVRQNLFGGDHCCTHSTITPVRVWHTNSVSCRPLAICRYRVRSCTVVSGSEDGNLTTPSVEALRRRDAVTLSGGDTITTDSFSVDSAGRTRGALWSVELENQPATMGQFRPLPAQWGQDLKNH